MGLIPIKLEFFQALISQLLKLLLYNCADQSCLYTYILHCKTMNSMLV